jgi:hypothetical protein
MRNALTPHTERQDPVVQNKQGEPTVALRVKVRHSRLAGLLQIGGVDISRFIGWC